MGCSAWVGFTLPSALALLALALVAASLEGPAGFRVIHALKLVAVAVVAQAIWVMARTLCPDRRRAGLALLAMLGLALAQVAWTQSAWAQVGVIALGALLGSLLCRDDSAALVRQQAGAAGLSLPVSTRLARACLIAFFALLIALPLLASGSLVEIFDRAGALVFGGGHVVLPLLEASTVETGRIAADTFSPAMGPRRRCPGHCSPSPPGWELAWPRWAGIRQCSVPSLRCRVSSCRGFCC
ncbi:chromate transporter [Cobetia marina]